MFLGVVVWPIVLMTIPGWIDRIVTIALLVRRWLVGSLHCEFGGVSDVNCWGGVWTLSAVVSWLVGV